MHRHFRILVDPQGPLTSCFINVLFLYRNLFADYINVLFGLGTKCVRLLQFCYIEPLCGVLFLIFDVICCHAPGGEWDYVILSTVRSLPRYEIDKRPTKGWLCRNLGFIVDENQINVALTRARKGLVIMGEPPLSILA